MTSYIVVAKDQNKRQEYLDEFRQNQEIDQYDFTIISQEDSKNKQSIGVAEIKLLREKTYLKPIKSKTKAVILEDAHLLTIEAQNALLKTLEEPPAHTNIILSTDTIEPLLPTILSRCLVIKISDDTKNIDAKEKSELYEFINLLPKMQIGERLKLAENLARNKDEALEWIEKLILVLRENILENYNSNNNLTMEQFNNGAIRAFQSLHTLLKTTNTNPRFAIENTLLSL